MGVKKTELITDIRGHDIDTTVLEPQGAVKGSILFLHGAGESSKDRFAPLAEALAERGYRTLNFSMPGHGNSSGSLLGQTLAERDEVAREMAWKYKFWPADIAVGVSMGGHTALSLLGQSPEAFSRLVLTVPAAYDHAAHQVAFGPEFSAILRTTDSFRQSKAVTHLQHFKGDLAIVQAGQDKVIPPAVYDVIKANLPADKHYQHVHLKDSGHQVTLWLSEQQHRLAAMAKAIDEFDFAPLSKLS